MTLEATIPYPEADNDAEKGEFPSPSKLLTDKPPYWTYHAIFDYVVIGILAALMEYIYFNVAPFERQIKTTDPEIQFPRWQGNGSDIVPYMPWLLFIQYGVPFLTAFIVYLVLLAVGGKFNGFNISDRLRFVFIDFHAFTVGLVLAVTTNEVLTGVFKNWVGRLRPDALGRIAKYVNLTNVTVLTPEILAKVPSEKLFEARRSFPSGHASGAWVSMMYLSLFLGLVFSKQIAFNRPLFVEKIRSWRILLPIPPLILATYVCVSRMQQNVHNPTDVIGGGILGALVAIFFFFFYYNTVTA